ncbi:MAG: hypothetical protein ABSF60_15490 [Verrucomicrobiota bacterium]
MKTINTMKTMRIPAFAALRRGRQNCIAIALLAAVAFTNTIARAADPLPSWNDGPAKQAIIDFVTKVTTPARRSLCPSVEPRFGA